MLKEQIARNQEAAKRGAEYLKRLSSVSSVPQAGHIEKRPLPDLPDVAAFDFDMMPKSLKLWAKDITDRMQCPADYIAVTIMASLGAVIGRKVGIRPQNRTDWTEYSNQWALIIGRPGVLKSPAMEQALTPLKKLASEASEKYEEEIADYQSNAKLSKLQQDAAEKEARAKLKDNPSADVSDLLNITEPDEPTLKRYIANDSTAASLGELLRQNPNGILVYRDEMVSLLKGLDREDAADARGFYLTGWSGESGYTFDRIGRGLDLRIPAVCLSLLGSTQPGRISEYLKHAVNGGSGDDGLIQRFGLMVWPDISGDWRDVDEWPSKEARVASHNVFKRLDCLDPFMIGAQQADFDDAPYLRFSDDALLEFREWREGWERKLRTGDLHPALESHLAKYRKLVPGLALSIHLADDHNGAVSHEAILKSLAWAEYLETHAVRAYSSVTAPETVAAKAILRRINKGDLPNQFTARDVYRNGWAHLTETKRVHEALTMLAEYGHLKDSEINSYGRPSIQYEVIP